MGKPIPPGLPWQVETSDGVVHGGASPLTVTVSTTSGGRNVTATSSEPGSHFVDFGVPGGAFDTLDNTETFDYPADGTFTVTMSNGRKSGSKQVTVPGTTARAADDEEPPEPERKSVGALVDAVTHKKKPKKS